MPNLNSNTTKEISQESNFFLPIFSATPNTLTISERQRAEEEALVAIRNQQNLIQSKIEKSMRMEYLLNNGKISPEKQKMGRTKLEELKEAIAEASTRLNELINQCPAHLQARIHP